MNIPTINLYLQLVKKTACFTTTEPIKPVTNLYLHVFENCLLFNYWTIKPITNLYLYAFVISWIIGHASSTYSICHQKIS